MSPPLPKISDCEAVVRKATAAVKAATQTLLSSLKPIDIQINGKPRKSVAADPAIVKKAEGQYKAALAQGGYHNQLLLQWFGRGKNQAANGFEQAGNEWLQAMKKVNQAPGDPGNFGIIGLLKKP